MKTLPLEELEHRFTLFEDYYRQREKIKLSAATPTLKLNPVHAKRVFTLARKSYRKRFNGITGEWLKRYFKRANWKLAQFDD